MDDNELDSLRMALEQAANGGRSNADVRACCADADNALSTLRARVAELERQLCAETPPDSILDMAECAAIMALCGYFSRMRGPFAFGVEFSGAHKNERMVNLSRKVLAQFVCEPFPLYAGSAPVPAAQAVDVCRVALEEACVVSWIAADLSTIEGAKKAIASLCAFDVQLATDPATNGGKSLQPVPAAQAIDTSTALSVLSKVMQDDADFAWTWHCNIAMTAQDAGAPHDRANVWAANFMRRAFDVDTLTRVNAMLAAKAKEGEK